MKNNFNKAIHFLHTATSGTLATHSMQMPGYPYASTLPFSLDENHHPVFFISALAEHTKNLDADARASFLVTGGDEKNVLNGTRMTLVGEVRRFDASREMMARHLRYQPEAERYLALGDFAFFRMAPKRVRYIAGFGQMGWIEDTDWAAAAILSLSDEENSYRDLIEFQAPGVRLLGMDCYGFDIEQNGTRHRQRFPKPIASIEKIHQSIKRMLADKQA